MTFKHITSSDNPVVKQLKKLADNARERRQEGKTLLDGVHLIEAYLATFGEPDMLIIPEGKSSVEATALIQQLADIPTIMLPTLMFAELTPVTSSTGIVALVKTPQLPIPIKTTCVLLLEDIQDPGNLGSMLRTAAAAGVDAVYLSHGCTDAFSPKALRGGQGAQFVLPIIERVNLLDTIQDFRVSHGHVYAMSMHGESLYDQDLIKASAFVIGNEGAGISAKVMAACSLQINIPMTASRLQSVESLNAAAAAAICLFECQRQRLIQ
jgi:RNA methyltransferase, TrmH family